MDNVSNLTKDLINTIKTSEEYLNYQKAKQFINSNLDNKNKVNLFKKMQIQMEIKLRQGINISDFERKELQDMYTDLTLDENINMYLIYEKIVFKTITSIYDELVNSIDVNLDFMD